MRKCIIIKKISGIHQGVDNCTLMFYNVTRNITLKGCDIMAINFGNSSISSLFGNYSNRSSSGTGINFSDYAMIRSGAYKKLMKSYYSDSSNSNSAVKNIVSSSIDKDSDVKNTQILRNTASDLYKASQSLNKSSIYEPTGRDKDGNIEYDMEGLYDKASEFVTSYNSMVKSFDDIKSNSILSKGVYMVNGTSKNANSLSDIGIKVNSDNTLSIDKEKFTAANVSDIKSVFKGSGSFGSSVLLKSSQVYSLASSELAGMTRTTGSAYTGSGMYANSSLALFQKEI